MTLSSNQRCSNSCWLLYWSV